MQRRTSAVGLALCAVALAAIGCAKTSTVGVSAMDDPPPARALPPKRPSVISSTENPLTLGTQEILGDVDGDGFDDFVVVAGGNGGGSTPNESVNLFYGRPEFPEQISVLDADAVFERNLYQFQPLGDVNGDELADFSFRNAATGGGFEIVFGDRTRAGGRHQAGSVAFNLPEPQEGTLILNGLRRAGDINCDGIDDILVSVGRSTESNVEAAVFGPTVHVAYLVFGSARLPSGPFDPSWADASFEPAADGGVAGGGLFAADPSAIGDVDADGCDDLVILGDTASFVFYGDPVKYQRTLFASDADAALVGEGRIAPMLGDLDGDGANDLIGMTEDISTAISISIKYGSRQRWSGQTNLAPELSIGLARWTLPAVNAAIGDIDTVAGPELLLALDSEMYVVRGIGERRRGHYEVREHDRFSPRSRSDAGSTQPVPLNIIYGMSVVGDVDGDGGSDIISSIVGANQTASLYLIPSTPRAPD